MKDIKQAAKDLVSKMTLEEKVSQMVHQAAEIERLSIPSYNYWNEALHGVARSGTATVFPQAIALAATFDTELVHEVADVISTEGRAKFNAYQQEGDHDIYKGLTYWSPNINIFRDPRWGRGHETYGEDPYLTERLGVSFIEGLQGNDPDVLKSAACAKHFAVHSGPESLRHEFNAVCDEYDLWNTYLPAFEAAVKEAKVESVMGAYNRTLDEPCCGSELLLKKILRDKWKFDGHVVSDCWAIQDFHQFHKITKNALESVTLAIRNGCDLNCGKLFSKCVQAVEKGLVTEEQIDQAVTRLIITRMRLGLLGAPENKTYSAIPYEVVDCQKHIDLNLETAKRSLVLLKNDGALPLDSAKIKTLGVIGPNANSRRALEGNYEGTASRYITPLEGLQDLLLPEDVRVLYAQGCHMFKDRVSDLSGPDDRLAEALAVTRRSDAVVVCLGLDADIEGEGGDTSNEFASGDKVGLELIGRQQHLLEKVVEAANGKPVILVLISGSALAVEWADAHVNGILQAFYPGAQGGKAIAQTLFGQFNPEGKLPVTFYRSTNDLPDFCDYSMNNRTYRYFQGNALYPFGFGLSYTSYQITSFSADAKTARVSVQNTGKRSGRAAVQIYVSSPGQKELRNLCGLKKIMLEAGETKEVELPLSPQAFSRWDKNGDLTLIPGQHTLYAGLCQPDERSEQLSGTKALATTICV